MVKTLTYTIEIVILAAAFFLWRRLWRKRFGTAARELAVVLACGAALIAVAAGMLAPAPTRLITLTALNETNENSSEADIYLIKIWADGKSVNISEPKSGKWTQYGSIYSWFAPGDKRRAEGQTDSITFQLEAGAKTELIFKENRWKGKVLIQTDGYQEIVDTYWNGGEDSRNVTITLPAPDTGQLLLQTVLLPMGYFVLTLVLLWVLAALLLKFKGEVMVKAWEGGPFGRLRNYRFLFEELVKRDFKKKYKRTVLGMAWSVLSPLLTLLVMRLVFTQFFGRTTAHYTIYLFCGNLIFSYFNESTSQGMTSLVSNAGIFTKVNVPKYLFLFSKNVQTLINFGLTLCVFFAFCVLDNITFTWKFICLLYPVFCLVLFNVGVGLILSALFVFFKDIQYLWSVFTMLLMYMSAIFYTIENYSPTVQNLFLLNPVYLFIRYFRKIVIDATVPTVWFHLLMLVDVAAVLFLGCWMYKKYNTKFLYYV